MMNITEKEYQQLVELNNKLGIILSRLGRVTENTVTVPVTETVTETNFNENKETETVAVTVNKNEIKVNSLISIFNLSEKLLTNKVIELWDNLPPKEKEKAIENAKAYYQYQKNRGKEPYILYYIQQKHFMWERFQNNNKQNEILV